MDENYTEQLKELEAEARSLPNNLRAASAAGNATEIIRLKARERDLPSETFAARVMALRTAVEELECRQRESYRNLEKAREATRDTDGLVAIQMRILDVERERLNSTALTALTLPKIIEREIDLRSGEISSLKKLLSDLLDCIS